MIRVYDDVLPDPMEYRRRALARPFGDVTLGPDTFRGIATPPDNRLTDRFAALRPALSPVMSFLRKSPEGQPEPNFIHSDADMGTATGIYYMNPDPAQGDGTAFWRLSRSGAIGGAWTPEIAEAAKSEDGWTRWNSVEACFNRLVVFPADWFHSRALLDNYGSEDKARLIQVVFAR